MTQINFNEANQQVEQLIMFHLLTTTKSPFHNILAFVKSVCNDKSIYLRTGAVLNDLEDRGVVVSTLEEDFEIELYDDRTIVVYELIDETSL